MIRENYLSKIRNFYDSDLIKILVGIRRCGKSVILEQIVDELKNNKKLKMIILFLLTLNSLNLKNFLIIKN